MMPALEQTVIVTLLLFVVGLAYQAGRHSVRVDHLERDHREVWRAIEELRKMCSAVLTGHNLGG